MRMGLNKKHELGGAPVISSHFWPTAGRGVCFFAFTSLSKHWLSRPARGAGRAGRRAREEGGQAGEGAKPKKPSQSQPEPSPAQSHYEKKRELGDEAS